MKKYFVTFVNYSSDYNSEEDMERYNLFKKYNSKRNKDYCLKHNYEYIEADEEVFKIPHLFSIPSMPEFEVKNNNHFARWQLFKNFIDNLNNLFKNWKPQSRFTVTKVDDSTKLDNYNPQPISLTPEFIKEIQSI